MGLGKMKEANMMSPNKIKQEEKEVLELKEEKTITLPNQENYFIATQDGTYHFTIKEKQTIYLWSDNYSLDLTFQIKEKGDLTLYFSCLSCGNKEEKIQIFHETSKTTSNIFCHGLSLEQKLTFTLHGTVPKNKKGCLCNQNSIIHHVKQGTGEIKPNLYIDEYDVIANHSAFVGPLKKEDIFYLNTKGISTELATHLLLKSFLIGNSKDQNYNKRIEQRLENLKNRR